MTIPTQPQPWAPGDKSRIINNTDILFTPLNEVTSVVKVGKAFDVEIVFWRSFE